jgi:hypothetical protein
MGASPKSVFPDLTEQQAAEVAMIDSQLPPQSHTATLKELKEQSGGTSQTYSPVTNNHHKS